MALNKPRLDNEDIALEKVLSDWANKLYFMKEYTTSATTTVAASVTDGTSKATELGHATISVTVKGVKKDDPSVIVNAISPPSGLIVSSANITADDTIEVDVYNSTISAISESVSYKFMVMKRI